MPPHLGQIQAARRDDTCLFRLTGEFDLSNASKIRDAIVDVIRREDRDIVVDLKGVRFMDAQVVRALVRARTEATRREVAFVVVPPADRVAGQLADLVDPEDLAA
jgi:anti-sigma B factor antagonist